MLWCFVTVYWDLSQNLHEVQGENTELCQFPSSVRMLFPSKCGDKTDHQCQKCGKYFITYNHLYAHTARYCGVAANILCCYCNYRAKRIWDIRVHIEGKHKLNKSECELGRDFVKLDKS